MRNRIKALRSEHGYREQGLAKKPSISVRTLRRYQSGDFRLPGEVLMKLSAIFGVSRKNLTENVRLVPEVPGVALFYLMCIRVPALFPIPGRGGRGNQG